MGLAIDVPPLEELDEEVEESDVDCQAEGGTEVVHILALRAHDQHHRSSDHLKNLKTCDELVDGRVVSGRSHGVVRVHDGMNSEIHQAEDVASAVVVVHSLVRVHAEGVGDDMVIPMKKWKRPFPEDDEEGVHELENLGLAEEEDPACAVAVLEAPSVADALLEPHGAWMYPCPKEWVVDGDESGQAECRHQYVPEEKRSTQYEGRTIRHEGLESEYSWDVEHTREDEEPEVAIDETDRDGAPSFDSGPFLGLAQEFDEMKNGDVSRRRGVIDCGHLELLFCDGHQDLDFLFLPAGE